MIDKQDNLSSADREIRESFQNLILEVLSILPKYIQNREDIPIRETLKVVPLHNGYQEKSHKVYDLISVIPNIYSLKTYNHCLQLVSENKQLRPHSCSYFVILSSFIRDYLEGVNPEKVDFDQKKFDYIFEEYIDSLLSKDYESVSICPLIGFESDTESITLDEGLSIRKITPDELNEIWDLISSFDQNSVSFKDKLKSTKYVIEQLSIKTKSSDIHSDYDLISFVILAMRLLKSDKFWANRRSDKLLLPWKKKLSSIHGITNYDNPLLNSYHYFLSKEEITDLRRTYILVKNSDKIISAQKDKSISRSIEWFNRYFYEFNIEHRFIFLMLLMESLCSSEGEKTEILYKLSNRISLIIGRNDEDIISIAKCVKKLYGKRSEIIHGSSLVVEEKYVTKAEEYSRRLLNMFLLFSSNGYTKNDIFNLVNHAIVSKSYREELDRIVRPEENLKKYGLCKESL
ncbi:MULTISPECIES: HEPN domain-containing protein [Methanosarcina]|uniref:Uncharacterized protein n=3 Tax=Methanosarcina barkeri TaxID=2208 RepID=A0A0E3QT75_METBA|nr:MULTISPECIES: HEPN domain-containing protein [Methanosarcina]AKB54165.1 hypothetical protein MSBRM_1167 [Methanosarcina barkeri MS]AKB57760.1 hypothetical protein MSBR2_1244 [Methanosarcina barkeri 227]AKJ38301.1 hypothetical protein MCM1_1247 [Methanosarcina barkeri CM1]OED11245.1 hypothetical protein A9239_00685 [Methanosarcina sp. A14]